MTRSIPIFICCFAMSLMLAFSDRFTVQSEDAQFVKAAADGGMLEVKLGELAVQRSKSDKFKTFGKAMIKDHTKANNELKALARKKQMEVPASLSKMKQQMYDSLAAVQGEQFDMLYMNMMIASHEETIGLFQTEANEGKDADLKKWADSKVPALKHHLRMAMGLFPADSSHASGH